MIADAHLSPGAVLDGRYAIVRLVKAGGMGAVYEAEDQRLPGHRVAIKEMLDAAATPQDREMAINRFLSEIQVLGTLSHPNIPRVTDQFPAGNRFYFVMEFLEGTDLSTLLRETGTPGLPEYQVIEWGIQVCQALEYLHGLVPPITHRDIKPSNLLRRVADGRVLLIDFGIARVTNPAEGLWIGTPGYAPPEQQLGRPEPRSDLYALGATLHELLSGRKPASFEFPSFEELGVEVAPALAMVIRDALAWNAEERIASATVLRQRLQAALGYEPGGAPTGSPEAAFTQAVTRVKDEVLDPLLRDLLGRYANECHTTFLPKHLEYLALTFGSPTPFEFIVKKNAERRLLEFSERQGLLSPVTLGTVDPADPAQVARIPDLIAAFVDHYESFKHAPF